jgi:hypothetical protein
VFGRPTFLCLSAPTKPVMDGNHLATRIASSAPFGASACFPLYQTGQGFILPRLPALSETVRFLVAHVRLESRVREEP